MTSKGIFGIMLILFLSLVGASSLLAADSSSLFAEASAKYAAGDFKAAAALYQQIVDSKKATAAVYYNLGNAHLRLGKKGAALIDYERAFKASPRDRDLRWNLSVLKNSLPDRFEEIQTNFAVSYVKKTAGFFQAGA